VHSLKSGLRFALIAAWTAPALPLTFVTALASTYYLKFGIDVLGLAPGALGLAFGLSRVWEGLASPLVGHYSDRTRSRLGRRRVWLLAGAAPIALATGMIWAPPAGLAPTALLAWIALGLFALATALPCVEVPRLALPAELSDLAIDRTRLFAANGIASAIAGLLALTLGIGLLRTAGDPRGAALRLAVALALLTLACVAWPVVRLREPPENLGRGGRSPFAAWGQVLRNPHQQRILLARFLQELPMGAISVLAPFAFQYTFRRPELTEAYMIAYFVPNLVSVAGWVRLTRRFRKVDLWIASRAVAVSAFALLYLALQHARAGVVGTAEMLVPAMLLGIGLGSDMVLPYAIGTEVIDHDELVSGRAQGRRLHGDHGARHQDRQRSRHRAVGSRAAVGRARRRGGRARRHRDHVGDGDRAGALCDGRGVAAVPLCTHRARSRRGAETARAPPKRRPSGCGVTRAD
jgi:Na+/melibiose symporter-like transporter